MNNVFTKLLKILPKINQVENHELSTNNELNDCKESVHYLLEDMCKLETILDKADQSLSNDMDTMLEFIIETKIKLGDMAQEMQNLRDQLIQVAGRYAKRHNITDD